MDDNVKVIERSRDLTAFMEDKKHLNKLIYLNDDEDTPTFLKALGLIYRKDLSIA